MQTTGQVSIANDAVATTVTFTGKNPVNATVIGDINPTTAPLTIARYM